MGCRRSRGSIGFHCTEQKFSQTCSVISASQYKQRVLEQFAAAEHMYRDDALALHPSS